MINNAQYSFIGVSPIDFITHHAVSRHISDTVKRPPNLLILALKRALIGKTVVEYNNDIKGFFIDISAILSWQYPGSIGQHLKTLQTLSNHLSIQYFNTQYTSNTQYEYLLQNLTCSDVFFFKFMSKALSWGDMM